MDDATLRKRVLTRLAGAPSVILPIALGATALLASWGLGLASGPGTLVGLGGVLFGVGMLATRWLLRFDSIVEEVIAETEGEHRAQREAALDGLDEKLRADDDPRTENALRRLRDVYARLRTSDIRRSGVPRAQLVEIAGKAERLFRSCLGTLEETYELWETAERMTTANARQRMFDARERLLVEVEQSVDHLARIVDDMHGMGAADDRQRELAGIRAELDQTLEVARRVEERMKEFRSGLDRELGELD